MPAEAILNELVETTGWNEATQLMLCLEYIENQQSDDAFEDFLEKRAEDENVECT